MTGNAWHRRKLLIQSTGDGRDLTWMYPERSKSSIEGNSLVIEEGVLGRSALKPSDVASTEIRRLTVDVGSSSKARTIGLSAIVGGLFIFVRAFARAGSVSPGDIIFSAVVIGAMALFIGLVVAYAVRREWLVLDVSPDSGIPATQIAIASPKAKASDLAAELELIGFPSPVRRDGVLGAIEERGGNAAI